MRSLEDAREAQSSYGGHSGIGPSCPSWRPKLRPAKYEEPTRTEARTRPTPEGTRPRRGPADNSPAGDPTRAAYDVAATFFDEGRGAAERWMASAQNRTPAQTGGLVEAARPWLQLFGLAPGTGHPPSATPPRRYPDLHDAAPRPSAQGEPWYEEVNRPDFGGATTVPGPPLLDDGPRPSPRPTVPSSAPRRRDRAGTTLPEDTKNLVFGLLGEDDPVDLPPF